MDAPKRAMNVDLAIGGRIRAIRISCKVSADELAKAAKMSLSDYSVAERGKRRFRALELFDIAKTLDVELSDIVSALREF
jgi:transcriptional regulator with XRE-family HTH domain